MDLSLLIEYGLVLKLDLADIHRYEQAREHSVELLKKWLSTYKFKNWKETEETKRNVTPEMRREKAKEVGQKLNNTKRWHAHSRRISIQTLQDEVGLKIEDFDQIPELQKTVKDLHSFIEDYTYMETNLMLPLVRMAPNNQQKNDHK